MSAPTAAALTGNTTTTCWTKVSTFLKNLVSDCSIFLTTAINRIKGVGFAHYYAERNGYLFVGRLGAGIQGTVVLVRSVSNQQLYARKRKDLSGALNSHRNPPNEAEFAIPHEHIARIVEQTKISCVDKITRNPATTTADIIQYCSSGDVSNVINKALEYNQYRIPSVLAWRLLRQLLSATIALHTNRIIHQDIKANNIFIHWADGDSVPDFFLGDFGCAKRIAAGKHGHVPRSHSVDFRAVLSLYKYVANVQRVSGGAPIPDGIEGESWEALEDSLRTFRGHLDDYQGIEDKPEFEQTLQELEKEVKAQGQEWEKKLEGTDLSKYRKVSNEKVRVFRTKEALLDAPGKKPPGPWQIAKVQQKGGKWTVLKTYSEVYCRDEHDFSN